MYYCSKETSYCKLLLVLIITLLKKIIHIYQQLSNIPGECRGGLSDCNKIRRFLVQTSEGEWGCLLDIGPKLAMGKQQNR